MTKSIFRLPVMILLATFFLVVSCSLLVVSSNAQTPYQTSATAKYVSSTAYDTVTAPTLTGAIKTGIITNESISIDLKVWFSYKDSLSRDPNSYVLIKAGKSFSFTYSGKKIFRQSATTGDSVFSQIIYGEELGFSNIMPSLNVSKLFQQKADSVGSTADTISLTSFKKAVKFTIWSDSTAAYTTSAFGANDSTYLKAGESYTTQDWFDPTTHTKIIIKPVGVVTYASWRIWMWGY